MKTTLFLSLACASLVLSSCEVINETVSLIKAASTLPTSTPAKTQVATAPSNLSDKTIVFDYSNAVIRHGELDDGEIKYGAATKASSGTKSITFNGKTKDTYTKTGAGSAKIDVDDSMSFIMYELTFTSDNSGTATYIKSAGENEDKTTGITFTIKSTTTGFAPSNVGDKVINIEGEMNACFTSDNTTGNMSRAMATYTKTGDNTAKIEHVDRYGEVSLFKLQFTSPNGGKVVGKNKNFTIKDY